jgi:hypothetical protein
MTIEYDQVAKEIRTREGRLHECIGRNEVPWDERNSEARVVAEVEIINSLRASIDWPPFQWTCTVTEKRRFTTRTLAKAALRVYEAQPGWEDRPTRPYHCSLCNGWHLTSQEPYRGEAPRKGQHPGSE